MANVSFKRGPAANLPAKATDGVFYLTTDTNRLYVGNGEKLAELNKYIRQVNTTDDLPAPGDRAVGDFVHVKTGNMLLVCKDTTATDTTGWTQVNAQDGDHDTYVTSISKVGNNEFVTSDSTGITVQFNINQTKHNLAGGGSTAIEAIPVSFKIAASDLTTANKVAIGIGATAVTGGGATVAVKGTGSDGSSVALKPGSNVSITADSSNNITVSAVDTKYTFSAADNALKVTANGGSAQSVALAAGNDALTVSGASNKVTVTHKAYTTTGTTPESATTLTHGGSFEAITGVETDKGHLTGYTTTTFNLPADKDTKVSKIDVSTDTSGGLSVKVTNNDSSTATGSLSNGLYYTVNGTKYYNQAALPVYNTDQIDAKFKGLNAMVYKGTIAASGATVTALPTSNVSIGDTYLVAATTGTYGGHACRKGDLLIASGTEGTDGFLPSDGITWTYVPSGDDVDTQYSLKTAAGVIKLVPSTNANGNSGTVSVVGQENNIDVATTGTEGAATITITHAAKTAGKTTSTASPAAGKTVDVVGGVSVDSTGHVSSIDTKTITLPNDTNTTYTAQLIGVATNASSIQLKAGGSGGTDSSISFAADGNITLTGDASKKTITLAHKAGATVVAEPAKDSSGNAITTQLSHGGSFTVATSVVADSTGHVTKYGTQTFKLPSDNNTTYSLSAATSAADNTATITNTLKPNSGNSTYGTFKVKSNNLSVSATTDTITMDFEWGTF